MSQVPGPDNGVRGIFYMTPLRTVAMSANGKVIVGAGNGDNLLAATARRAARPANSVRRPACSSSRSHCPTTAGIVAAILNDAEQRRESLTRIVAWDVAGVRYCAGRKARRPLPGAGPFA